ncbi:flavodoxin family protein [Seongchinamella sediminis]|uniref:Flavodoxin family protein n=1 Tax=Seongchinamella sediminis TaxID=2283635 RepID=A0A3L7DWM8_9GAMM|nr:flavodoxin family protein [Seongchinamella sediminis]RLQ21714.1 flavodoxin family protein [Seongchinamella sediminis]
MTTVAVIYHSATGTTKQLADAISEGINSAGNIAIESSEYRIVGEDIIEGRFINRELLTAAGQADGIIFGSPTYMGGVSAQFKAFADATGELWSKRQWANKIAAGFTIGSNYSGDQLSTIQYLNTFANQHGMLWASIDVPGGFEAGILNRLGAQSGLIAQTRDGNVDADDLTMARYLGARVARLAAGNSHSHTGDMVASRQALLVRRKPASF